MSWSFAVKHALAMAYASGRRYYVHGYRTSLGEWRYGAYRTYRPQSLQGRVWQ